MDPDLIEDDSIMFSNDKLEKLLKESGLPLEEVFKKYIEGLKYETIKDFPLGMYISIEKLNLIF